MKLLSIILLIVACSCSRRVHTSRTVTNEKDTSAHYKDSVAEVIKTLSEAYESLLQTSSSTGVVFDNTPCDTVVSAQGMPHIINRVVVRPDGTKEFEGRIKSYKDESELWQHWAHEWKSSYDSLSRFTDSLVSEYSLLQSSKVKDVRSSFIPWYFWLIALPGFALYLYSRYKRK